nr:receptor-like protein 12 [Ipomoea batatas]
MATSKMLLFVIHILLLFSLSFEIAISESSEGRALVKWKNTLSNTHVLHSWSIANLDNVCSNWMGVTCNDVGAVYDIKLENLNLSGTLESLDFASFPNLTHFSLYENTFIGSVPYTIANLSQLRSLDLSWNYFQNFIPTEIERLTKLRSLNIGQNNLTGIIPSQIFSNMSRLRYFDCGNNLFQGPLPTNLVKLSMLKGLELDENQFSGSIAPTIGNISSLRVLDLNDNMLQGTIPLTLCNLLSIEYLILSKNTISESSEGRALVKWKNTLSNAHDVLHSWSIANLDNVCSNWMGVTCSNVGVVYEIKLESLNLSGTLESLDFISFPNLTHFSLYNNTLIGSIPYTIANLSQLRFLDLSWNYFQNFIPIEIERLTKLTSLNLGVNNLTVPTSYEEIFPKNYAIFNHPLKCSFYRTIVWMDLFLNAWEN